MNFNEVCAQILDHYGRDKQEIQAAQELNELQSLMLRREDQRGETYIRNIVSEIADVEIMIEQIKQMHRITDDYVEDMIKYKLRRQLSRIEKEVTGGEVLENH